MVDDKKFIKETAESRRQNNIFRSLMAEDCYKEAHSQKLVNIIELYKTFKHFFLKELSESMLEDVTIQERPLLKDDFVDRANKVLAIIEDAQDKFKWETKNISVEGWKDIINLNIQKSIALKKEKQGEGFDFSQGKYKGLEKNIAPLLTESGTMPPEATYDKQ